ncbi:1-deoxy-D-xylulose-5-phosphate reductoisomerase [Oscillospiraceae bacterium OttesenSCG-928-G22]|nr:1-deoxy-D-xylulose-5-phosphate reductoisomerase [Oscillospiraceae bacterium OttesenSCG-928-G22]
MIETCVLLGSTGSIGVNALSVMETLGIRPLALTGNRNVLRMEEQARQYRPRLVALADEASAVDLRVRLVDTDIAVAGGEEGVLSAAAHGADAVLSAIVGIAGLRPTIAAIPHCRRLALANKESLVCAGEHVLALARENGTELVPVDSEHSAIFQCLSGNKAGNSVRRLLLTASGGPFRGRSRESLQHVTVEEALSHPTWSMGAKITVDSATMMNKGLEVIEAMHLFGLPPEQIDVVVHPESAIHSMVEFTDGSILAQIGAADMRLPIQYALTFPERGPLAGDRFDVTKTANLSFSEPDRNTFNCLALAESAAKRGGNAGALLNGANEAAVELFLSGRIGFLDISRAIEETMERLPFIETPSLADIFASDAESRRMVSALCGT